MASASHTQEKKEEQENRISENYTRKQHVERKRNELDISLDSTL